MFLHHHDLRVPFEDRWLVDAGAESFVPSSTAYIVDATPGSSLISIDDIEPLRRVPIFNKSDEEKLTADERVLRILRGFVGGVALPPVKVVRSSSFEGPPFELFDGAHRLYLSLAVRYTHVPAIELPAELKKALDAARSSQE